jgi:hypothetical protein
MAKRGSLFDGVLENSVNTGVKNNLASAITSVGVKIPANTGLWEYPEIIRKNLVSKTINGINISAKYGIGEDVLSIEPDGTDDNGNLKYIISTVFDTKNIDRPEYAADNNKWNEKLTVKDLFDDLFGNILPKVKGVHAGDMTVTDISGDDTTEWNNTYFNKTGNKTGLEPTSRYIRLYLTCQAEPIYIHMGNLVKEVTNGYNVTSSDTVEMRVDALNSSISAHVNIINESQLKDLGIISTTND